LCRKELAIARRAGNDVRTFPIACSNAKMKG
jgi:hypothetical protein